MILDNMKDADFRKLMESASPATQAAGKRALADNQCVHGYPLQGFGYCRICSKQERDREDSMPIAEVLSGAAQKPAIRIPKPRVPNKTEARFMAFAADRWRGCFVHYAPVTFHLPSGCKYTPDVMMRERPRLILGADDPYKLEFLTFIEVKGPHIHNQRSIHAFKEARAAFPMFRWIFAQYRDGEWALAELPQ